MSEEYIENLMYIC